MSAWKILAKSLRAKGGGLLRLHDFDEQITTGHASRHGAEEAKRHGIFWSSGSRRHCRYGLTVKGWMWCDGAVRICPGRAGPIAENADEKRVRIERLLIDSEEAFNALALLTVRQLEVLTLYAKGFNYREIGDLLSIKGASAETIGQRIIKALGCDRIIEAAMLIGKAGLE